MLCTLLKLRIILDKGLWFGFDQHLINRRGQCLMCKKVKPKNYISLIKHG